MHRTKLMIASLALVAAPAIWAQTRPEKPTASGPILVSPNPVPPQFRGQPTNPPSTVNGSPPFRSIGAAPGAVTAAPPTPTPAPAPVWPTISESQKQDPALETKTIVVPPPLTPPAAPPVASPSAIVPPIVPQLKPAQTSMSIPSTPTVLVEKRGPETVNAGTSLVYEINVRNLGQTPVEQVYVEDELPAGTRFVSSTPPPEATGERLVWKLGQLDPAMERKFRVEVIPGQDGEYKSIARLVFATTTSMKTTVVRPQLAMQMTGPEQALSGDQVPFNIQVSNPGTGPVNNLVLRVKLPSGLQHPQGSHIEADLGSLPAGGSKTIPLRVTAGAGGVHVNEVSASGEGGLEASAQAQVAVLQPQLQLRRTGPAKVMFKGEVTEELEVNNPGNAPANNVTITQVLPAGLDFVGASDGALFDPVGRSVTWKLGQQPAGTIRRVVLKAKANAVGDQPTRAVAFAERGLESKTEAIVNVEGIPALLLEVVDVEDPVEVGGELTYEIRVVNQGSCPCTNIRISCDVPEGLSPGECHGPTTHRINGTQIEFEPLPKLGTKADVVYRVKVRGTQPGDYRFKVQMNCEQMKLPVNKEESSRVYAGQ